MQAEADFSDGWWRGAGEGGPEGVNTLSFTGFVFLFWKPRCVFLREKQLQSNFFKMATCEPW